MSSATLSPLDLIMRQPDGCHLHAHCLTCPLPKCYFDRPEPERIEYAAGAEDDVVRLRNDGLSVPKIMAALGVSRMTVFRHLRRAREA